MKRNASAWAVLAIGLGLAGPAAAQQTTTPETPAQQRARLMTQSLNGGPAESIMGSEPALPPIRATPVRPPSAPARPPVAPATITAPSPAPSLQAPLRQTQRPPRTDRPGANESVTEALNRLGLGDPNAVDAESGSAIPPLEIGYYVRGDLNCDQVWPGEGNLAWLSATAFVLDFGGCEPGVLQSVGGGVWREDQQCVTELGNDGGLYSIGYQVQSDSVLARTTRLAMDRSEERDLWTHCATADVPEEARFQDAAR